MKISIIHPSRSRPELAYHTFLEWMANCDNPNNVEYVISIDNSDPDIADYYDKFNITEAIIWASDNNSAIQAINEASEMIYSESQANLYVIVSDDFSSFYGWDSALIDSLKGKSDFLVKTQDGIQPTLITLPIMDRKYYERFGYVYHPSYIHMSSDVEMTMVGYALDKIITLPLLFKHNHYSVGGIKKDAISMRNDRSYSHGYKNLEARKKINFGLKPEEIVKDFNQIKWK